MSERYQITYGHTRTRTLYRVEGDALVCYGYSEHYDRDGVLVKKTKPEMLSRLFTPRTRWESFVRNLRWKLRRAISRPSGATP